MTKLQCYFITMTCILLSANARINSVKFQKVKETTFAKQEFPYSIKARSLLDCTQQCISRNSSCFSFDKKLQQCDIGSCSWSNSPTTKTKEFYITCDMNDGFKILTSGSVTACVWKSTSTANYTTARDECKARSAQLYTVKSLEKLYILQQNPTQYEFSWLGLNDIANENIFTWEDDKSLINITYRDQIFIPDEPTDALGNEDCVIYHGNWKLLTDYYCDELITFFCEKPFFNFP